MDSSSQLNPQAMKGVAGSNHDWPYFVSPTSNLSAFAAPFSVNPYASIDLSSQFMDSTESAETVSPIHYQTYGYDFFSNPVRELDSAAQFPRLGFPSFAARSSLVEAQPYPVSTTAIHDHASSVAPYHWSAGAPSSDWPSLEQATDFSELGFPNLNSVSWDQFPELNGSGKGKQVGVGSTSLSSKETNVTSLVVEEGMNQNQGNQDVKDSVNSEVSYIIDGEKFNVLALSNHLHDTSSWWGTVKPMPGEFSGASVLQSPSVSLETHGGTPLKVVADSGNNHLSNIGSYDKHARHVDKSSRVDTFSSMPRRGLTTDMNIDDIIADQHVGHSNFYNRKEASLMPCPGTSGCFDPINIRMNLGGRNEPSSSNKTMVSDNNISRDADDYIFRGTTGNHHANIDNLSLSLGAIEDVNFVEKSFEGGDRCNPAEDSPCWKGASAAHFSYFKPSAVLPQEYVHKKEISFGPVIQESQNYLLDMENNTKKSPENSNGYQMQTEFFYQGTGSPRKFSVTNFAYEDCKSGSALNGGPFQFKPNCDFGIQFLDSTKIMENSVPPAKATNCESGSSHKEYQVAEKNKLMTQKQQTSCIGDAETGCTVNKCLEHGSSYTVDHGVPLPSLVVNTTTTPSSVVHTTTIPSSVVDTTTPINKTGNVTIAKLNVQMLVDTMQNLSELLLYHCKNDVCELKERDYNVLKDVINNLNTCALKNGEQIAPPQECLFNQNLSETFNYAGELREFHQNASLKRPQLTKIGPESSKVEDPLVAMPNLHFRSAKPLRKLSDSISSRRDDTEMTKHDDMTKDLKRTLSENFHNDEGADPQTALYKNLWLEAEAELCSVYYKARYNQIKIEMDNHAYKEKKEMERQSKSEFVPTLIQNQCSATKVHQFPNPGSCARKLSVLDAPNLEGLSCLNFFTDENKPYAMTPGGRHCQNLDSSIDSYIVSSDEEPERNDESSVTVTARYQVLRARADQSCIDTTNPEEPDMADKSSPRGSDNQNAVNFCQDSPNPEKNSTDYEAAVVARFHILKSRHERSGSISLEGKQLDGVGSAFKDTDDTTIAKKFEGKSLDVHENPSALVRLNSYIPTDKSIPEEFHRNLADSQEIQLCRTTECQPSNYNSDGFSSDWEHVEKSL